MSEKKLTEEQAKEQIKEQAFLNNMFYDVEFNDYTEDEEIIKERIEKLKDSIERLDATQIIAPVDRLLSSDYFLRLLAHNITSENGNELNENFLNRLIEWHDDVNNFFNSEGDNAFKILELYDGQIVKKNSEGFYTLDDTIVNKVIKDSGFYVSDETEKKDIKNAIFDTWENQKEILTNDSINEYSEKRNGINFKHFIFCEEYIKTGKVKTTCDNLGISRNTAYLWLKDEKVQEYLKDRQDEIKRETDDTFIQTYRASFNELNKMINGRYLKVHDKIKAIDVFLKHYENIERLKQPINNNDI
jgi:hypothetical protein